MAQYEYATLDISPSSSIIPEHKFTTEQTGEIIETETSDKLEIYNILGSRGWELISENLQELTATFKRRISELTVGPAPEIIEPSLRAERTYNFIAENGERIRFSEMHYGTQEETRAFVEDKGWKDMHIVLGFKDEEKSLSNVYEMVVSNDDLAANIEFFLDINAEWLRRQAEKVEEDGTINVLFEKDGGLTIENVINGNRLKALIQQQESDKDLIVGTYWNLNDAIKAISEYDYDTHEELLAALSHFLHIYKKTKA